MSVQIVGHFCKIIHILHEKSLSFKCLFSEVFPLLSPTIHFTLTNQLYMTGDSSPLGGGNSIQPIHVKIVLMAEAPFIYLCQIHLIYFS